MRQAGVSLERTIPQQFGRQWRRIRIRNDLVVVAVQDQGRHLDRLEILRESVSEKALMQS